MKILFLTNNLAVTQPLLDWLISIGEDVVLSEDKIDLKFIVENDISFIISYNYLPIIKKDVLDALPHRVINMHISLLPWNRGTYPNIWSFIENTPSGVTIHEVHEGLDTGDILLQEELTFNHSVETLKSSYNKLHERIQELYKLNHKMLTCNDITPVKQTGEGSFHLRKDLAPYQSVIDYDDTICTFMHKIMNI